MPDRISCLYFFPLLLDIGIVQKSGDILLSSGLLTRKKAHGS
jgi:hypothetical protein